MHSYKKGRICFVPSFALLHIVTCLNCQEALYICENSCTFLGCTSLQYQTEPAGVSLQPSCLWSLEVSTQICGGATRISSQGPCCPLFSSLHLHIYTDDTRPETFLVFPHSVPKDTGRPDPQYCIYPQLKWCSLNTDKRKAGCTQHETTNTATTNIPLVFAKFLLVSIYLVITENALLLWLLLLLTLLIIILLLLTKTITMATTSTTTTVTTTAT